MAEDTTRQLDPLILLVEDDPEDAQGIMRVLKRLPARVRHIATGESVFEYFLSNDATNDPPKLVVLDMWVERTPHGETDRTLGLRALRHHRLISRDTPVIVFTGHEDYEQCVACMRAGASDYLLKVVADKSMVEVLRETCEALLYPQKARRSAVADWLGRNSGMLISRFSDKVVALVDEEAGAETGLKESEHIRLERV